MSTDTPLDLAKIRALTQSGAARSIRVAAGISLRELGDAVGVYPSTIYRWETGNRCPKGDPAVRYSRVLSRLMNR